MVDKTYKDPGSVLGAIIGAGVGLAAVGLGYNALAGASIIIGLTAGTVIGKRIYRKVKKHPVEIEGIPAIIWGRLSDKVYIYVHGKNGCKEEAELFASAAALRGWQVLSIDLPCHGERAGKGEFVPWEVVPELKKIYAYVQTKWHISAVCASSIGAYFAMLAYKNAKMEKALFISPILDMPALIDKMMCAEGISAEELEKQKEITAKNGEVISSKYYEYAKNNPITAWKHPTKMLFAGKDEYTDRATVYNFAERFGAELTLAEKGEHWFHTPEQLEILEDWVEERV